MLGHSIYLFMRQENAYSLLFVPMVWLDQVEQEMLINDIRSNR